MILTYLEEEKFSILELYFVKSKTLNFKKLHFEVFSLSLKKKTFN